MNPDECVSSGGHSWYLIRWSPKRFRYERECSLMGCEAWQHLQGMLIAKDRIVATKEDQEHVHDWKSWNGTSEDTVSNNLFYYRGCRNCKAEEGTADLKAIGNWIYFPVEVAIRG